MLEQIYRIQKDIGERISNVVLMGSGEPFDNTENVFRFLDLISCEEGLNISQRNLTISTCGLIPGIEQLTAVSYTHLDVYKRQGKEYVL